MVLYARADCTAQLRKLHGIGVSSMKRVRNGDYYEVEVTVIDKHGKPDTGLGIVWLKNRKTKKDLEGTQLANAMMKAETKAKRRATLSCAGLGMMDESEIDELPGGYGVVTGTGRVMYQLPADTPAALPAQPGKQPTAAQAEVVREKTKAGAVGEGAFLFYELLTPPGEDARYKIDGTHSLKTLHRGMLLGKKNEWWDGKLGAIVVDNNRLEALKYEFERCEPPVPFRYLKPAEKPRREPGVE
jgi:hypothetical protein